MSQKGEGAKDRRPPTLYAYGSVRFLWPSYPNVSQAQAPIGDLLSCLIRYTAALTFDLCLSPSNPDDDKKFPNTFFF